MRSVGHRLAMALFFWVWAVSPLWAGSFLFDATKREMAGNADWVIDADTFDLNLPAYPCTGNTNESHPGRYPSPAASGIISSTLETYWTGGISAWAVDLVKAGHSVETLPPGGSITFNDGSNPQDLSLYDVFIVVEPQTPFTAAEKAAILGFVQAGGGLFMVGDHETSDRDCDGWDSPHIWNDLTGASSSSATGLFGIWFRVDGLENQGSEDWFDDAVDNNTSTDPADPIIQGPFGSGAGGLGLFGSTSLELGPSDNPTVTGHVWRSGQTHDTSRVTFATASYGGGRVAAIGDSSPADDDTGDPGDSLYPGWDKAAGGVSNREIHLNACHWLLHPLPDTTPPLITDGPTATPGDCTAQVNWTTDELATSSVDYGPSDGYGFNSMVPGLTQNHAVTLTELTPLSLYHFRVSSFDQAGNGPTQSADDTFTTGAAAPPLLTSGPLSESITGTSAVIRWTTDELATSEVQFGLTGAYGSWASAPGLTLDHSVPLTGLTPSTEYHFRVLSTDSCTNGPTYSGDGTFTTGPAAIDLSGWVLKQYNSSQTYTLPAGTFLPSGGYLVISRDASRAAFEAYFPAFPAGALFLNSNESGSCASTGCFPQINGGESFELYNAANTLVDGPTIAMSTTHRSYQRQNPGDPSGSASSWNIVDQTSANPGEGAGNPTSSGVRINEMSDAADFTKEFIELYYDAGLVPPDEVPPAAVTDLVAQPLSAASVRLTWTASGDDGTTGTAAAYDIRTSPRRILTEADFSAATPLLGEPAPHAPGTQENFQVSDLAPDTVYYFALKTADEVPHFSGLSNSGGAVTAPAGSPPPAPHLVISQIRIAGSSDDVIELYNPTDTSISLAGHSVQYLAANGNFGFRANLTGANTVPAHGWYLIAANGYSGTPSRDDSLGTSNLSATAGHALLVSKTTNVSGCSDELIVDKVGYGATAICPEGGSGKNTATPGSGLSVSRRPGGSSGHGQDTDINSDDFLPPASPVFHNRESSPASPPSWLGNVRNTLFLIPGASGTQLEWANAAGATQYHVYRGEDPHFLAGSPSAWSTVTQTNTIDAALPPPGAGLFYVIRASNGVQESVD